MTRWHGITMGMRSLPLAEPAAREALGLPHAPGRCQLAFIGDGLAVGNLLKRAPYRALERRAFHRDGQIELRAPPREVLAQLRHSLRHSHRFGLSIQPRSGLAAFPFFGKKI